VELDDAGQPTTFLTVSHFQRCLRACGATRTGEKFAAECLGEILPRLGLIEDTRQGEEATPVRRREGPPREVRTWLAG
jgi:hypothetical protein